MMSEEEIRNRGIRAMHNAITMDGEREQGVELGTWLFAQLILGELFKQPTYDEAVQWLEDNPH